MRRHWFWMLMLLVTLIGYPPQWYPQSLRIQLSLWFGAPAYQPLPGSLDPKALQTEQYCAPDLKA